MALSHTEKSDKLYFETQRIFKHNVIALICKICTLLAVILYIFFYFILVVILSIIEGHMLPFITGKILYKLCPILLFSPCRDHAERNLNDFFLFLKLPWKQRRCCSVSVWRCWGESERTGNQRWSCSATWRQKIKILKTKTLASV